MNHKKILVLLADSQLLMDKNGASDSREFDTIKEAKVFARHGLTDEYMRSGEMSSPFNYSQIVVISGPYYDRKEEIHSDYYRKGYREPIKDCDPSEYRQWHETGKND